MDCRVTIAENESFRGMVLDCLRNHQRAEMIYDHNGLTRAGGMVVSVTGEGKAEMVTLDSGETVAMAEIVAVNGVFADDYAGC